MPFLDELVLKTFKDHIMTPTHLRGIVAMLRAWLNRHGGEETLKLKKLEHDLKETETAEAKLFEAIEKGIVDLDDRLKARMQQHKARREELTAELSLLKPRQETPIQTLTPQKIDAVSRVILNRLSAPSPFSRAYLKATISEIRVNPQTLTLKGTPSDMANLIASDGQIDASKPVLGFVSDWCARRDCKNRLRPIFGLRCAATSQALPAREKCSTGAFFRTEVLFTAPSIP